jgi:two-component system, OmpR family, sensor kinase
VSHPPSPEPPTPHPAGHHPATPPPAGGIPVRRQLSADHFSARLRSVPLRVKLVASVLALVAAALVLVAVASTLAVRIYLVAQTDQELSNFAESLLETARGKDFYVNVPPGEYMLATTTLDGRGLTRYAPSLKTDDLPPRVAGAAAMNAHLATGEPFTVNSVNGRYRWRMVVRAVPGEDGLFLQVARQTSDLEEAVSQLIFVDLLVGVGALIALAAIGAAIVRRSLRPLVEIEQTAAAIAAGDLTKRVPDPEPGCPEPRTELGRLSRALNAMLAQIEMAFTARALSETAARAAESAARDAAAAAQESEARALRSETRMRQFVADASHELRTPLTTIRGFAELYRQGAVGSPEEAARVVRRIEDEAQRMGLLVEDLLLLARLDRERPLMLAPVELPVLAVDAVQAARVTAPDRTIELEVRESADELVAFGDDARLRQVVGNLMTNALTHTPPDASITLRLYPEGGNLAVLEVADTGPGLTPEQQERVFERFYRADAARSRRADAVTGTGLGLAIVAAIVSAHHGRVEVASEPGKGTVFRVRLPLVPAGQVVSLQDH